MRSRARLWLISRCKMMSRKSSPSRTYPRLLRMLLKALAGATEDASGSCLSPFPTRGVTRGAPAPFSGCPLVWERGLPRLSPPEVAQRVGTEEVVVADVLIPCDIHHLQQGVDAGGGC